MTNAGVIHGQYPDIRKSQTQIRTISDTPVEFTGQKADLFSSENAREVRIGLFLPEDKNDHLSRSVNNAAVLAISEFNEEGGYNGVPYRLIRRWSDVPWKAGSREVIKLVYEDSVVAIIGSTNGNSTHIAEQIAAKAWIPLLSPISADPTLTQIRIPWMFRLTPDFASQSKILVQDGLNQLSSNRVGIICSSDHDGRVFAQEIQKALINQNVIPSFHFNITSFTTDYAKIADRIRSFNVDAVFVYMNPDQVINFLGVWEQEEHNVVFFLPWTPGLTGDLLADLFRSQIYLVKPFQAEKNAAYQSFLTRYKRQFGERPLAAAAYIYDAFQLLRYAVEKSGLNRQKLRDTISNIPILGGVTGDISWDNTGGNISSPILEKIDP
jgi:branched-chain amino acid transport system substrate-binding protein